MRGGFELRHGGADDAIRIVCAHVGHKAWANRCRALKSALQDDLALDAH